MKIAIVEDSLTTRALLEDILFSAGYSDIVCFSSGKKLLEFLDEENGSSELDLILMDIVMPELDGTQVCKVIKEKEKAKDIPVIMITSRTQPEDLEKAFRSGAMDYIKKPVNRIEFLARVRSALTLKNEMDRRKIREKELLRVTRLLEKANEQLQKQASLDGLTEIPNRRFFDEKFKELWEKTKTKDENLGIIMVDIDNFKNFNDYYGHIKGDGALKKVAQSLKKCLPSSGCYAARYGGEEFVMLLTGIDEQELLSLGQEVCKKIRDLQIPNPPSPIDGLLTVSVGIAAKSKRMKQPQDLLDEADRALFMAKEKGKNCVQRMSA